MASEAPRRSEPADPLAAYSVLSLFPRTLGVLKEAPKPYDLERDLDSLHDHLKSILDSLENRQFYADAGASSGAKTESVNTGIDPDMLGRTSIGSLDFLIAPLQALRSPKRLLDQAKAIVSNSSELLNISIPSKAASEDKNGVNAVMANEVTRKRRPASGRERPQFSLKPDSSQPMVTLEPTFDIDRYEDPEEFFKAFEMFENASKEIQRQTGVPVHQNQYDAARNARPRRPETLRKSFKDLFDQSIICSQVTCQNDIVPGPVCTTQPEVIELTDETELAGSKMAENKVNELLDDLLSGNCQDFDGDDAVNLLQERLQIEPVNIDNLSLPDMQDIRGNDLNASEGETSQRRKALSDIQNILKGLHSKSPSKSGDVSRKNIPSPQTKSPLAPLILLKRRMFKDNSIDPFSTANIDVAATKNSPLSNCVGIHSDDTDMRKDPSTSGKSKSPMVEEDAGLSRYSSNDNGESFNLDFMTEEDLPVASADIDSRTEKVAVTSPHFDVDMQNSTIGEVNHNKHNQEDPSHCSTLKDDGTGGTFASTDRAPEKQTENSLNARTKSKARPPKDRLRKGLSRRHSLAAAGASWNSGVRRSTRIRSRPLEYWKGERFLYGRVHESLATVIGIKYVSPGKADGKPTMRVKSYVSDEYKELVELASLH